MSEKIKSTEQQMFQLGVYLRPDLEFERKKKKTQDARQYVYAN